MCTITFQESNKKHRDDIAKQYGQKEAEHIHIANGFSLIAKFDKKIVGFISIQIRQLPSPLSDTKEAFIDIIDVHPEFRRQGIAKKLIELAIQKAKEKNLHQISAWSSEDKQAAIQMWRNLDFGLCFASILPERTHKPVNGFHVVKVLKKFKLIRL